MERGDQAAAAADREKERERERRGMMHQGADADFSIEARKGEERREGEMRY